MGFSLDCKTKEYNFSERLFELCTIEKLQTDAWVVDSFSSRGTVVTDTAGAFHQNSPIIIASTVLRLTFMLPCSHSLNRTEPIRGRIWASSDRIKSIEESRYFIRSISLLRKLRVIFCKISSS